MSPKTSTPAVLLLLFAGASALPAASILANPNFDTDLSMWTTSGSVAHSTDFAVLTDDGASLSSLHQSAAAGGSTLFQLSFDFIGALSATIPVGQLPDTGFFSLYLGDGAFVSPGAGAFDEVVGLFDVDSAGVNALNPNATVSPHPTRAGWSQFSMAFSTNRANITPYVELLDQNTIDGDSSLGVDTFLLEVVPEPSIGALLLLAGGLIGARRRR